jgi:rhodanese-related sulfurtransferase
MNRPMAIPALDPLYADIRRRDPVRPALLLDIRELDEFRSVRVEDCLFIPMSQLGVRLVGNVAGGIDGWQRMGLSVRRGAVEPGEGQLPG